MKDFKGNDLSIGDNVIYIAKTLCGGASLAQGTIKEIRNGCAVIADAYKKVYSADTTTLNDEDFVIRVKSQSIYKIV